MRCHGRIFKNIIGKGKLVQFDALSLYNKYTDIFDYEDVPEKERKEVALSVANWVIDSLNNPSAGMEEPCGSTCDQKAGCCG